MGNRTVGAVRTTRTVASFLCIGRKRDYNRVMNVGRFIGLGGLAMVLIGCNPGDSAGSFDTPVTVVNNTGKKLSVMPASVTPLAAGFAPSPAAEAPKALKVFSASGTQYVPTMVLLVLDTELDIDRNLVGMIRLTKDEVSNATAHGGLKVALEPNKMFVKFGTRSKVYDYFPTPKVAGELTLPEEANKKLAK